MTSQLHLDLVATRAAIDTPKKWLKGRTYLRPDDGTECRCLGAAINAGTRDDDDTYQRVDAVIRALGLASSVNRYDRVIAFNDHRLRTHAEVLALLDQAIEANP